MAAFAKRMGLKGHGSRLSGSDAGVSSSYTLRFAPQDAMKGLRRKPCQQETGIAVETKAGMALIETLAARLGPASVLTEAGDMAGHLVEARGLYTGEALAV